jgi:hypothetical protein
MPLPPEHSPELNEQFEAMRKNLGFVPNSILIMQRTPKYKMDFDPVKGGWSHHCSFFQANRCRARQGVSRCPMPSQPDQVGLPKYVFATLPGRVEILQ